MLFYNNTLSASTIDNIYVYYPYSDSWQNITDRLQKTGVGLYFPTSNSGEYLLGAGGIYRFSSHSNYLVISDTGITDTDTRQIFSYLDTLFVISIPNSGKSLYLSSDHGDSWIKSSLPFNYGGGACALGSTPKGLLFGFIDSLYLKTKDTIFRSCLNNTIRGFFKLGNTYFSNAGTSFFRSNDSGLTWVSLSTVPSKYAGGKNMLLHNRVFFIDGDSVHYSDDSCQTWNLEGNFPWPIYGIASNDSIIYADINMRSNPQFQMHKSLDSGKTWIPIGFGRVRPIDVIFPYRNVIFMCGIEGVYRCNSDGSQFIYLASNQMANCNYLETDSEYLYVGTQYRGIFRAKLDDVLNDKNGTSKPIQFENISQALYPNPSDATITIETSEATGKVRIFDEQGKEILLKPSDIHIEQGAVKIDIRSLSEGVYLCNVGARSIKFIKSGR